MSVYLIVALPRSRTAWLAHFLTSGKSYCFHDAMRRCNHPSQLFDFVLPDKITGFSETGLCLFPDWVNNSELPTVVIHRSVEDVERSGRAAGLVPVDTDLMSRNLDRIDGLHVNFEDINDRIEEIWDYCTGMPFDSMRASRMAGIHLQDGPLLSELTWQ